MNRNNPNLNNGGADIEDEVEKLSDMNDRRRQKDRLREEGENMMNQVNNRVSNMLNKTPKTHKGAFIGVAGKFEHNQNKSNMLQASDRKSNKS